jgi:capsular polysaccharide biosynthesis protein
MNNQELSLREAMDRALARWWIIVLFMTLGGIAGWIVHFFQPAEYQATAVMTITMEFEQGRILSQYEEDYSFSAAGNIIRSTEVIDKTIAGAQASGYPVEIDQIRSQMLAEGKQSTWELHVRNRDPELAAELANLWAKTANAALNAALEHAILAEQIQIQISNSTSSQPNSGTSTLSNELVQEQQLSGGVISIMRFAFTSFATVPDKPVLFNLGVMVLAGACIGFLLSLWLVNSYKIRHHD